MKSSAQTREHDPLTEEEQDDEHVHELRYRRPFDVLVPRQSHHPSHVMVESPFVFFTDGSVLYSTPNLGRGGSFCTRKPRYTSLSFLCKKKFACRGRPKDGGVWGSGPLGAPLGCYLQQVEPSMFNVTDATSPHFAARKPPRRAKGDMG